MEPNGSGNTVKRSQRFFLVAAGGAVLIAAIAVIGSRRNGSGPGSPPSMAATGHKPGDAIPRRASPEIHGITATRRRELIANALRGLDATDTEVRRDVAANQEVYSNEVLRKALGDREPAVREDAIRRLPFLKCSGDVAECLIAASRDTDAAVAEAALDVIQEMAGAVQAEFYAADVTSENAAVRQQAVEHQLVLDSLDSQSVQIIQAGLSDSVEEVRGAALDVIKFQYGRDFKSPAEAAAWLRTQSPAN